MRATMMAAAACAFLVALPGAAGAQSPAAGSMEKSGIKGSPNADGYGKGDDAATKAPANDQAPSASDLKGPPNANGYGKQ